MDFCPVVPISHCETNENKLSGGGGGTTPVEKVERGNVGAAKAPEALGFTASSPGVSAVLGGAAAATESDGVGSAGCIRLSSRQVSSIIYSMSTRQWRFLELYSTRLISRPIPWYTQQKEQMRHTYVRKQTYTQQTRLEECPFNNYEAFGFVQDILPVLARQTAAPGGCSVELGGRSSERLRTPMMALMQSSTALPTLLKLQWGSAAPDNDRELLFNALLYR
ncbi:hypothetical protein EYF80_020110 [Liparis tanakae]|uniref:Uncharacterized protein n=1 Tax=Liparis tanakae TaxID=230148 RepID=A0A4Z2HVH8_9TELE|nr:hypothetical protein EYF80_020110 [Liparis tanakae]